MYRYNFSTHLIYLESPIHNRFSRYDKEIDNNGFIAIKDLIITSHGTIFFPNSIICREPIK